MNHKATTASARAQSPDRQFKNCLKKEVLKLDKMFTKVVNKKFDIYDGNILYTSTGFTYLSKKRKGPLHDISIFFKVRGLTQVKAKVKDENKKTESVKKSKKK